MVNRSENTLEVTALHEDEDDRSEDAVGKAGTGMVRACAAAGTVGTTCAGVSECFANKLSLQMQLQLTDPKTSRVKTAPARKANPTPTIPNDWLPFDGFLRSTMIITSLKGVEDANLLLV